MVYSMNDMLWAFSLTLFAGFSTVIGSVIALFAKRSNTKFLSVSLGFSAGVMIYVSMAEIFPKAQVFLINELGTKGGSTLTTIAFFGGMFLIGIIDKLLPSETNPHETKSFPAEDQKTFRLKRIGVFTAIAISIHNFPEGLATFISALQQPSLAIPVAVAIALHNIPEGIAVSVPIYQATGSKLKAFKYSFLSGLAEPIGALIGFLLFMPFMTDLTFGVIFAGVAGIMVFISLDELLPAAKEYGEHHLSIYGLISGMIVMAISLLLFL